MISPINWAVLLRWMCDEHETLQIFLWNHKYTGKAWPQIAAMERNKYRAHWINCTTRTRRQTEWKYTEQCLCYHELWSDGGSKTLWNQLCVTCLFLHVMSFSRDCGGGGSMTNFFFHCDRDCRRAKRATEHLWRNGKISVDWVNWNSKDNIEWIFSH